MEKIVCKSIQDTDTAAGIILKKFPDNKVFAFYGELGAGKTTLIKSICRKLGSADTACSPSYTIINEYKNNRGEKIYHLDFYRIKSEEEVYDIGYEEYFYSSSYCFIEWPEKIEKFLPENTVKINILIENNKNSRIIYF